MYTWTSPGAQGTGGSGSVGSPHSKGGKGSRAGRPGSPADRRQVAGGISLNTSLEATDATDDDGEETEGEGLAEGGAVTKSGRRNRNVPHQTPPETPKEVAMVRNQAIADWRNRWHNEAVNFQTAPQMCNSPLGLTDVHRGLSSPPATPFSPPAPELQRSVEGFQRTREGHFPNRFLMAEPTATGGAPAPEAALRDSSATLRDSRATLLPAPFSHAEPGAAPAWYNSGSR